MALGFDDMNRMGGLGRSGRRGLGAEDVMLPAAFLAMWAPRRMHEVGKSVEPLAAIAAKNWHHARTTRMAPRRAHNAVTVAAALTPTRTSFPHTPPIASPAP